MPDPDAALTMWAYIAGPLILGLGGLAAAAVGLLRRGIQGDLRSRRKIILPGI